MLHHNLVAGVLEELAAYLFKVDPFFWFPYSGENHSRISSLQLFVFMAGGCLVHLQLEYMQYCVNKAPTEHVNNP
jgi:hypothetical protein